MTRPYGHKRKAVEAAMNKLGLEASAETLRAEVFKTTRLHVAKNYITDLRAKRRQVLRTPTSPAQNPAPNPAPEAPPPKQPDRVDSILTLIRDIRGLAKRCGGPDTLIALVREVHSGTN